MEKMFAQKNKKGTILKFSYFLVRQGDVLCLCLVYTTWETFEQILEVSIGSFKGQGPMNMHWTKTMVGRSEGGRRGAGRAGESNGRKMATTAIEQQ